MHKTISVLLVSTLALTACSSWRNSRANPTNWFGSSTSSSAPVSTDDANALIPETSDGQGLFSAKEAQDTSVLIATIDELQIDPTPHGAIIYSTGTAARQGAFGARLTPVESDENEKNGVMEFAFRVNYPFTPTAQGTPRSRMVSDAINVSRQELEGIRLIRVVGQQNRLESRRR